MIREEWISQMEENSVGATLLNRLERSMLEHFDLPALIDKMRFAVLDTDPSQTSLDFQEERTHTIARRLMCRAIMTEFGEDLATNLNISQQVIWCNRTDIIDRFQRPKAFVDHEEGQFTWAAVRSISNPKSKDILQSILYTDHGNNDLVSYKPIIPHDVSVFEIHCFEDWNALVKKHPKTVSVPANSPSHPNPIGFSTKPKEAMMTRLRPWGIRRLLMALSDIPFPRPSLGNRSSRSLGKNAPEVSPPVTLIAPDWKSISEEYDAVHFSWMGVLLALHNRKLALAEGIIPLFYWDHEVTHWLTDCIEGYEEICTYEDVFGSGPVLS